MTLNESIIILKDICKTQGIELENETYAFIDDPIKMWRFLVALSYQDFSLGFDMFEGTCSGNAKLCVNGDFVDLIALDCAGSEFIFVPKSVIVIIPKIDRTPTFIFESSDYCPTNNDNLMKNIKKSIDNHNYNYVEAVRIREHSHNVVIFEKEIIDEIIGKWHSGADDAIPYFHLMYYFNRKVFAAVNVQLKLAPDSPGRIPLLLEESFPYRNQDKAIEEIDIKLKRFSKM